MKTRHPRSNRRRGKGGAQDGGAGASARERQGLSRLRAHLADKPSGKAPSAADLGGLSLPPGAAGAILHDGPEVASILSDLDANGLALGAHVLINRGLDPESRARVVLHELGHVAQTGPVEPDLSKGIELGSTRDPLEEQASSPSGAVTSGSASANVARRQETAFTQSLDRRPKDPEYLARQSRLYEAAKRKLERDIAWEALYQEQHEDVIAAQPKSLKQEIAQANMQILGLRAQAIGALTESMALPPDFAARIQVAELAVIEIEALIEIVGDRNLARSFAFLFKGMAEKPEYEDISPMETASAKAAFNGFYLAAAEVADTHFKQELKEWRERKKIDDFMRDYMAKSMGQKRKPASSKMVKPFALRSWFPGPRPRPPKNFSRLLNRVDPAASVQDWQRVLEDYKRASGEIDKILIASLPNTTEELRQLKKSYQFLISDRDKKEEFLEDHGETFHIPAVLYPKGKIVTERNEDGSAKEVVEAIPWSFNVEAKDGKWLLYDLTRPNRSKPFTHPMTPLEKVLIEDGLKVDPPLALFKQLDAPELFPEGHLDLMMPNGGAQSVALTHPWNTEDWLKAIGLTIAAIALIAGTAGAGTVVVAGLGIASAGFSVAGTLTEMNRKEKLGILTDQERRMGYLSIGVDVVGALALGLGSAVKLGASSAGTLAKIGIRSAGAFVVLKRAAVAATAAEFALTGLQAYVVGADLVAAYQRLQAMKGELSKDEYEDRIARLTQTALLTGALTFVSLKGNVDDIKGGGLMKASMADADGGLHVGKQTADVDAPGAKADAPLASSKIEADGVASSSAADAADVGWAPVGEAPVPQYDPTLKVEAQIDIRRGADGLPVEFRIRHRIDKVMGLGELSNIVLHQQVIAQFSGIRGRIRRIISRLKAIFGKDVPMHLQMELWKHRKASADATAVLASGKLTDKATITKLQDRLKKINAEIDKIERAVNDPNLRKQYSPFAVATRVVPDDFPKPPIPGYKFDFQGDSWKLVPISGSSRLPVYNFDNKKGVPTGGFSNLGAVEGKGVIGMKPETKDVKDRLNELGYSVSADNKRISRPDSGESAGMVGLTLGPDGRIKIQSRETFSQQQERIKSGLSRPQTRKLEALQSRHEADGTVKVNLVEGVFDTGVKWKQILNVSKQREMRRKLRKTGMKKEEIDRLIDGLVNDKGTVKVVLGTKGVRAGTDYRASETGGGTTAEPGVPRHHGYPLYLGGSHDLDMLFDLPKAQHDAVHEFFEESLKLPSSSALGDVTLSPNALRRAIGDKARPAAVVVKDGKVKHVYLDRSLPRNTVP